MPLKEQIEAKAADASLLKPLTRTLGEGLKRGELPSSPSPKRQGR